MSRSGCHPHAPSLGDGNLGPGQVFYNHEELNNYWGTPSSPRLGLVTGPASLHVGQQDGNSSQEILAPPCHHAIQHDKFYSTP